MFRNLTRFALLALAVGLLVVPAGAGPLKNAASGTPKIQSIDVIAFGPEGLLLIGDGRGSQLVAVETGDTTAKAWTAMPIDRIDEKLAGRIGAPAKGIEILHMTVNPASGTAYFAIRKLDDKKSLILTVDGSGKVSDLVLENVKHVALPLPKGEKAAASKVTDLAWAEDRVLVAAQANEEFACKVYSVPTPLDPKAPGTVFSTETYHVSHRKWETKAPMSTLMPFEQNGKKFVVGTFACTPVVKYPLEDLQANAKVKGLSVVELGSGNRPLNMFLYEKDGKSYVLMNTFRFHHPNRPFGPSPYITFRLDVGVLGENEQINEKALNRLGAGGKPATEQVKLVEDYHGVVHLDKLDKERALAIRQGEKGELTLTPLPLP
jgi:hypothetical protein